MNKKALVIDDDVYCLDSWWNICLCQIKDLIFHPPSPPPAQ